MTEGNWVWAPCLAPDAPRVRDLAHEFKLRGVTFVVEEVEEGAMALTALQSAARLVFVAWTEAAVRSLRLQADAAEALDRGKLYQAVLDPIAVPKPLDQALVFDLCDFTGAPNHEVMQDLAESLRHRMSPSGGVGSALWTRGSLSPLRRPKAANWPSTPLMIGGMILAFVVLVALAEQFGLSADYRSPSSYLHEVMDQEAQN